MWQATKFGLETNENTKYMKVSREDGSIDKYLKTQNQSHLSNISGQQSGKREDTELRRES